MATRKTYLTEQDHDAISAAVAQAEEQSAGEIVTILADRSDGYTDVALSWAIIAAFLEIAAFAMAPQYHLDAYAPLRGSWAGDWTPGAMFTLIGMAATVVFLAVMVIQMWRPLKFFLIPSPVKTARVHDRAVRAFKIGAERRTHGHTGILIYLSMKEHRAEILADRAIAERVDAEIWGEAMDAMLAQIKQGRIADGMIAAIERVGVVLAEHFPRDEDDVNELPDRLIEV